MSTAQPPPDEARAALVHAVVTQARPLVLNATRIVDLMWRADGFTAALRSVLESLVAAGPLPVPALAERLDLPRQAIQRQVDDLARQGLVVRQPNPGHRRSVLICATGQGRELQARISRTEHSQLGRFTATDINDDELRTAVRVLSCLNRDIRDRAHALRSLHPPHADRTVPAEPPPNRSQPRTDDPPSHPPAGHPSEL